MRALILSDLHQGEGGVDYDPARIKDPFELVIVAGDAAGRLTANLCVWGLGPRGQVAFQHAPLEIPTAPLSR